LLPGDRSYLTIGSSTVANERVLAFNPVTTNLLLVSRAPGAQSAVVVVLDAKTGSDKGFLNTTGVVNGQNFSLNPIAVADDGAIYSSSLGLNAGTLFRVYRWGNDNTNTLPTVAFYGDPGAGAGGGQTNARWGDTLSVRGAGANTQILMAPASSGGTNVALLRSADGTNFTNTVIAVNGVPTSFAQLGLAFGPGTNTFCVVSDSV